LSRWPRGSSTSISPGHCEGRQGQDHGIPDLQDRGRPGPLAAYVENFLRKSDPDVRRAVEVKFEETARRIAGGCTLSDMASCRNEFVEKLEKRTARELGDFGMEVSCLCVREAGA